MQSVCIRISHGSGELQQVAVQKMAQAVRNRTDSVDGQDGNPRNPSGRQKQISHQNHICWEYRFPP